MPLALASISNYYTYSQTSIHLHALDLSLQLPGQAGTADVAPGNVVHLRVLGQCIGRAAVADLALRGALAVPCIHLYTCIYSVYMVCY